MNDSLFDNGPSFHIELLEKDLLPELLNFHEHFIFIEECVSFVMVEKKLSHVTKCDMVSKIDLNNS